MSQKSNISVNLIAYPIFSDPLPVLDTLPSDITIGHSMIPGAKYGVFARQHILRGLVVGPLNLPLVSSFSHITPREVSVTLLFPFTEFLLRISKKLRGFRTVTVKERLVYVPVIGFIFCKLQIDLSKMPEIFVQNG